MIDALAVNPWIHALGFSLLQFVWQGAIIAMLTAAGLSQARQAGAKMRYGIACLGLCTMVGTAGVTFVGYARQYRSAAAFTGSPVADLGVGLASAAAPGGSTEVASSQLWSREAVEAQLPRVVAVWAVGVFALTSHLLLSWLLAERLRRAATRAVPEYWRARIHAIGASLGVGRAVRVLESSILEVPSVIGWLRPTILLPASLVAGISPFQLEAVLAHELAHIRRHDYLANVLQSLAETLFFYHPAVWWVSRQIRKEREYCCDDLAAEVCGDRAAYARALMSLEEARAEHHALAVAATDGDLLSRVRRLLGVPPSVNPRPLGWVAVSVAVATAAMLVARSATIQATATRAQSIQTHALGSEAPGQSAGTVTLVGSAQAETPVGPAMSQAPRDPVLVDRRRAPTVEEQVRLLEEQYRVAKLRNDVAALDRLLDDACVETNQNGNTRNKAELLELWRDFRISSLVIDSLNLRVAGDTVVATGRMTERNAGIDYMLFTRTWKSSGSGQWKLVSSSQFRDPNVSATTQPLGWVSPANLEDFQKAVDAYRAAYGSVLLRETGQLTPAPVPNALTRSSPIRIGGDIKEPKKIKDVKPRYPDDAKAAGVQGVVILEITLDTEGAVGDTRILRSIPLLDEAALDAVRQWKFTPTLLNGVPVPVIMTVTVAFTLG